MTYSSAKLFCHFFRCGARCLPPVLPGRCIEDAAAVIDDGAGAIRQDAALRICSRAALHSVAILHALRRQGLPLIDFTRPDEVLSALNQAFPMEDNTGMYFTLWYGVYDPESRTLRWSSAGHPPALLYPASGGRGRPLAMESFPVGMMEDSTYRAAEVVTPPGSRLLLYSDGAFDFPTKTGQRFSHPELLDLLDAAQSAGHVEVRGIEQELRRRLAPPSFEDDFSLLLLDFD